MEFRALMYILYFFDDAFLSPDCHFFNFPWLYHIFSFQCSVYGFAPLV